MPNKEQTRLMGILFSPKFPPAHATPAEQQAGFTTSIEDHPADCRFRAARGHWFLVAIKRILQLISGSRSLSAALLDVLMAAPSAMAETVPIQLKNGDTIHAERVPEESDDSITVVIHQREGGTIRLVVDAFRRCDRRRGRRRRKPDSEHERFEQLSQGRRQAGDERRR